MALHHIILKQPSAHKSDDKPSLLPASPHQLSYFRLGAKRVAVGWGLGAVAKADGHIDSKKIHFQ